MLLLFLGPCALLTKTAAAACSATATKERNVEMKNQIPPKDGKNIAAAAGTAGGVGQAVSSGGAEQETVPRPLAMAKQPGLAPQPRYNDLGILGPAASIGKWNILLTMDRVHPSNFKIVIQSWH